MRERKPWARSRADGTFNVTGAATASAPSIVQNSVSVAPAATLNLTGPGCRGQHLAVANSGNLNVSGGSHTVNTIGDVVNYTTAGTTSVGGGGKLVANTVVQDTLNVNPAGTIVLTAPATQPSFVNTLNMGGGKLDLQAGGIYVPDGSNTAAIVSAIQKGSGIVNANVATVTWTGSSGITSSTLAAGNPSTYGVGYLVNAGSSGYHADSNRAAWRRHLDRNGNLRGSPPRFGDEQQPRQVGRRLVRRRLLQPGIRQHLRPCGGNPQ